MGKVFLRMEYIVCTGMKYSILGSCEKNGGVLQVLCSTSVQSIEEKFIGTNKKEIEGPNE